MKASKQKPATHPPTRQDAVATVTKTAKLGKHASAATARACSGFSDLYLASPADRVALIRAGVPATALLDTATKMGVSTAGILTWLKLPRSTVNRHLKAKQVLPTALSERILGLQQLIGQVEMMVSVSGGPTGFEAAHWVADWLDRPLPALNYTKPADYLDTIQGQMLVASLLAGMQSGELPDGYLTARHGHPRLHRGRAP